VTLYQLLCGRLPWDVSDLPLAAAIRRLLDDKLVSPSLAVAGNDAITPRELRGDLDAIIAKALRKEPRARYADARALADDIERHLHHEPVLAREGARAYLMGSFVRRHWLPISGLALLFVVLLTGMAATAWQARVARREALRAEIEGGKAAAVKDFLLDIFRQSSLQNPGGAGARNVTAEKLLDIGAERIHSQLHEQVEVRGELLETLASLYSGLGAPDRALELAQDRIADLSKSASASGGRSWAEAQLPLARALIDLGRDEDAKRVLNTAQTALDALGDRDSVTRAEVFFQRARADYDGASADKSDGVRQLQAAIAILDRVDPNNSLRGDIFEYFGYYAQLAEDYRSAEIWKKRFLDFVRSQDQQTHSFAVGTALLDLGDVQALAREYPESEANLRAAVAVLTQAAGPDHPSTAIAQSRLGEMYYRSGRPAEAEPLLVAALVAQQRSPQGQADATETRKTLGGLKFSRGRLAEAEILLRENLEQLAAKKDLELRYAVSASVLVSVLTAEGKLSEAQQQYAASSEVFRRHLGEKSLAYAGCLMRGAALEVALGGGHLNRAAEIYSQLRSAWPAEPGRFPDIYARATLGLARTDLKRQRAETARDNSDALSRLIATSPERQYVSEQEAQAERILGASFTALGRPGDAQAPLRRAVELRELIDDADSIWLAEARINLAEALLAERQFPEAQRLLVLAARAQSHQPVLSAEYRTPLLMAQRRLATLAPGSR
jgi:eukaryotic-like serine/threonine-protein kinase